jgi:hypothetical protein
METLDRCRRFPALEHNSRWHRGHIRERGGSGFVFLAPNAPSLRRYQVSYLANVWSGLADSRLCSRAFAPFNQFETFVMPINTSQDIPIFSRRFFGSHFGGQFLAPALPSASIFKSLA